MNDLKYCVRHNGAVYCWDDANERIVAVAISDIEPGECPERALQMIKRRLNNNWKEEKC